MNLRRLRTLMIREVRATLRNPATFSVLVAVPLAALLVFGFILSTNVQGLDLGYLDADNTQASRRLVAELTAQGTFDATRYASRSQIEAAIVSGEISAAVIIPAGFSRAQRVASGATPNEVQVLYDGAEAVVAGNAEGFLRSFLQANAPAIAGARLVDLRSPTGSGVKVTSRVLFNPTLDGKPFMVSGTFGFVLSFLTVLLTAVSIVNEKITGTFEQLQVTPATGLEILLGKILPMGAVFTADIVLMMIVAGLVMGVWPNGSALLFVGVSAFYILVSLALGVIVSATSATAAEAVQKSVMLSIPLVQLSGFAFPIRNMPGPVQWVAEVFPATHYIRLARAIYIRGDGFFELLPELGMLLLFGALLVRFALTKIEARA